MGRKGSDTSHCQVSLLKLTVLSCFLEQTTLIFKNDVVFLLDLGPYDVTNYYAPVDLSYQIFIGSYILYMTICSCLLWFSPFLYLHLPKSQRWLHIVYVYVVKCI